MQGFRPPSVVADDSELAESLRNDDVEAVRTLVQRFNVPVMSVATRLVGAASAPELARDVFVQAWRNSMRFEPGRDFEPWLLSLAQRLVRDVDTEVGGTETDQAGLEALWVASMAASGFSGERRSLLQSVYVDGANEHADADDVVLDRQRLERRVAHVIDESSPDAVSAGQLLADPLVWSRADPGLAERTVEAVESETSSGARYAPEVDEELEARARRSRTMRALFIALGTSLAVLLIAIVGLSALSGSPQPADFTVELTPTGEVADVEGGQIVVTERDAGIEIELDAGLPRRAGGQFYRGVLILDDGSEVTVGSFSEGFDVTLFAGVALERAVTFRIVLDGIDATSSVNGVVLKADLPRR